MRQLVYALLGGGFILVQSFMTSALATNPNEDPLRIQETIPLTASEHQGASWSLQPFPGDENLTAFLSTTNNTCASASNHPLKPDPNSQDSTSEEISKHAELTLYAQRLFNELNQSEIDSPKRTLINHNAQERERPALTLLNHTLQTQEPDGQDIKTSQSESQDNKSEFFFDINTLKRGEAITQIQSDREKLREQFKKGEITLENFVVQDENLRVGLPQGTVIKTTDLTSVEARAVMLANGVLKTYMRENLKISLGGEESLNIQAKNRQGNKAFTLSNFATWVEGSTFGDFTNFTNIYTLTNWNVNRKKGKLSCDFSYLTFGQGAKGTLTFSYRGVGSLTNIIIFENGKCKNLSSIEIVLSSASSREGKK